MKIAFNVAERSTCDRAHVGAVIVRNRRMLTTGYNGAPAGLPHCDEIGHLLIDDHCVRTLQRSRTPSSRPRSTGSAPRAAPFMSPTSPVLPAPR